MTNEETLGDCKCLHKYERDAIVGSLAVHDKVLGEGIKNISKDTSLSNEDYLTAVDDINRQRQNIMYVLVKANNTPLCK